MRKTTHEAHYSSSFQNTLEKAPNVRKMRRFLKLAKMATMQNGHYAKMATMQRPLQNGQFASKNKIVKNMRKTTPQAHHRCSFQKTIEETPNIWKMRPFWKSAKMASLRQNIKLPQTCVKRLYKHITFVLCKRRLEKTANIRKIGRFGKLQQWPLRKGYSLCKMPSLAQTLKLPKTCVKRLQKHITAVLFKTRSKNHLIFEKWDDFENRQKWPLCKGYSLCKMVSLRQKIKLLKTCEKRLHKHITAVLFKKRSKKHLIFEKWDDFENRQKWPLCKGYSLCKMVSLRQKIKLKKHA